MQKDLLSDVLRLSKYSDSLILLMALPLRHPVLKRLSVK